MSADDDDPAIEDVKRRVRDALGLDDDVELTVRRIDHEPDSPEALGYYRITGWPSPGRTLHVPLPAPEIRSDIALFNGQYIGRDRMGFYFYHPQ